MATKIIQGCVGDIKITEVIGNYQPHIHEMIITAKKNIQREFEQQGYKPNDVIFEDL